MRTGVVKFFNQKNKFGFIIDNETQKEYYVHAKNVEGSITEKEPVSFELKASNRGDECVQVKKINA
ncbi:MAG: cold shock domain-containing protein [Bacteroidetes bacterium]|nr:cold shock domain-containing protein [Bacteroidota bacterium]